MKREPTPKKLPTTVCYRLPANYQQDLCRRAQEAGVSHGEYARKVMRDHLEDAASRRTEREFQRMKEELALLRGDLATLAEALLVLTSQGAPVLPTEARAWVEERLRQARKAT